uniref:Plant bHLH transcription factor ACT-like domain-containing protein n=1 Tax=Arundo donax TaxID=35708 RepID=A0A0A8YTI4_ARUDO
MVSREQKRAILHEKLQVLRSVAHSHAGNKMSIITDASTYIKDLKQKIAKLNHEIASAQHTPLVSVEVQDKGFLINVFMDKSSPGLLASVLEAFDELGLTVLEARASCAGSFRLEAVGEDEDEGHLIDAYAVEQAVVQAIKNCPST